MTGADILEALNQQYLSNQTYFLQISGLKYTFTDTDDLDHAYKVASVTTEDGTTLKADQKYKVVINDFLFGGGDGFSAFKKANLVTAIDQILKHSSTTSKTKKLLEKSLQLKRRT